MTPKEVDEQVAAYTIKQPLYHEFAGALRALLTQLLAAKGIEVVTTEARAKTIESYRAKIEREDKNYTDPITQVTDLAGLRIITYQLADIDAVSEVISQSFEVDRANSIDKRQSLEEDRFGYISVHYVVRLESTRAGLPEYAAFAPLRGEIQVRTVLQHAWAAIDHKLRYKNKEEIPANLRRQLFRISALLETADEEFESLKARIAEERAKYSAAVATGSLDIPLNVESLSVYVEKSKHAKDILAAAQALNISIAPHHPNAKLPEYSNLLGFLDHAGARSIRDFDDDLARTSDLAGKVLSQIVENWSSYVSNPGLRLVVTRDSLFRLAYFLALPPKRAQQLTGDLRFGYALRDAVERLYRKLHAVPDFTLNSQQGEGSVLLE